MSEQCEMLCMIYDGGEIKHHPNCVYYPESRTKMYDDAVVRIGELEEEIKNFIAEIERYGRQRDYMSDTIEVWRSQRDFSIAERIVKFKKLLKVS